MSLHENNRLDQLDYNSFWTKENCYQLNTVQYTDCVKSQYYILKSQAFHKPKVVVVVENVRCAFKCSTVKNRITCDNTQCNTYDAYCNVNEEQCHFLADKRM